MGTPKRAASREFRRLVLLQHRWKLRTCNFTSSSLNFIIFSFKHNVRVLLNPLPSHAKNEVDQRIDQIIMTFRSKAEQLIEELLASGAREFDGPVLDVPSCDAQPSALVLS
jgi:hypothetical protein